LCLFFEGVRELPLVGSKIHFIDELIVFFMVSMLLRGESKTPTSPRLQRGLTTYAFATHQKKIRFHALGFSTHSTLENTETLKQPP
jgi:hypothetical protein